MLFQTFVSHMSTKIYVKPLGTTQIFMCEYYANALRYFKRLMTSISEKYFSISCVRVCSFLKRWEFLCRSKKKERKKTQTLDDKCKEANTHLSSFK